MICLTEKKIFDTVVKHKQNELQNFGYNQWEKMNQLFHIPVTDYYAIIRVLEFSSISSEQPYPI